MDAERIPLPTGLPSQLSVGDKGYEALCEDDYTRRSGSSPSTKPSCCISLLCPWTRTERRFKVVLYGLHNVLRNTERANHPLAHLGEPVCAGPLLSNGNIEQARALDQRYEVSSWVTCPNCTIAAGLIVGSAKP